MRKILFISYNDGFSDTLEIQGTEERLQDNEFVFKALVRSLNLKNRNIFDIKNIEVRDNY